MAKQEFQSLRDDVKNKVENMCTPELYFFSTPELLLNIFTI